MNQEIIIPIILLIIFLLWSICGITAFFIWRSKSINLSGPKKTSQRYANNHKPTTHSNMKARFHLITMDTVLLAFGLAKSLSKNSGGAFG